MRKLMMGLKVGLLAVGLLAMVATPAMAQFADPLTLATSGVLLPFFGTGNNSSLLELSSPVGSNTNVHMIFYNAFCTRVISFPDFLTTNDTELYDIASTHVPQQSLTNGIDGLVAIGGEHINGFDLVPLNSPLHSRVYWINVLASRFRVLEPIVLDIFEATGAVVWSPIRTGATFFAPIDSPTGIQTTLYLICPRDTIQGPPTALPLSAFPTNVFPIPTSASTSSVFKASYPLGSLRARVYDTDENFLRNLQTDCNCLQTKTLASLEAVYSLTDTYTEMETDGSFAGFTGYKGLTFAGNVAVDLFGRLSNGNRLSLQGFAPFPSPPGCDGACR